MLKALLPGFLLYVAVGATGTAAQYAFLLTTVSLGTLRPAAASAIGALLGALVNFVLNALVTFGRDGDRTGHLAWATAARFFATAALAAAAIGAAMAVLVDGLHLDYRLAQLLVTGLLMCATYFVNSVWTFRARQAH
jgi:putative flippase GtrA